MIILRQFQEYLIGALLILFLFFKLALLSYHWYQPSRLNKRKMQTAFCQQDMQGNAVYTEAREVLIQQIQVEHPLCAGLCLALKIQSS